MMRSPRFLASIFLLALGCAPATRLAANPQRDLWAERLSCVVAIEFFVQNELDRDPVLALGTVIDRQGTVILPARTINPRLTPGQLMDFRVYRPGANASNYVSATYLGVDPYTEWHFLRIEEAGREGLRPVTDFVARPGAPEIDIADGVWGIGMLKKADDFAPYFMAAQVGVIQTIPQRTAIATTEVTAPGLPVFAADGSFAGLGVTGFGQTLVQYSQQTRRGLPVLMVNSEEVAAFNLADEVLPYLDRIPTNVIGRPIAWVGIEGMQPIDPEVASYLNLGGQTAVILSDVLTSSPASAAGLKERDILLSIDGQPLPRLKPDVIAPAQVRRMMALKHPGDTVQFGILRGAERLELPVVLAEAPPLPREAPRRYFDRLGFTIRGFVRTDAVRERVADPAATGVIAHFVKPNAPTSVAGLMTDDWIREIDGEPVTSFEQASKLLEAIEKSPSRSEFVLLTSRGGETAVLRVKLN